jgi:hypothetical protein
MADAFKKYHVYQEKTGQKPKRGDFSMRVHESPEEKSDFDKDYGDHVILHSTHNTSAPALKAMRKLGSNAEGEDMEKSHKGKDDDDLTKDLARNGEDDEEEDDDDEDEEGDDMEKSVQDAVGEDVNVNIVDSEVLGGMISKAVEDGIAIGIRKAMSSIKGELAAEVSKSIGDDLTVLRTRTANTSKAVQQIETAQEEILARVDTLVKSFGDNADLVKSIADKKAETPEAEVKAETHEKSVTASPDAPNSQFENMEVLKKAHGHYLKGRIVKGFDPTSLNAVQRGDFSGIDFSAIRSGLAELAAV